MERTMEGKDSGLYKRDEAKHGGYPLQSLLKTTKKIGFLGCGLLAF
jgi:hypothetical protein